MHFSKINDCICSREREKEREMPSFKIVINTFYPDPLLDYTIEITLSLLAMYLNKSQLQ